MANNLSSNTTTPLAKGFLKAVESTRVLTKAVDTQLLTGKISPSSGTTADFKRPHKYNSIETAGGDISSSAKSDIISGKATGTVQNYITVATEWENIEEATELDELDKILAPMARECVTKLELNMGAYMLQNSGLSHGTVGTVADAWSDVQQTGALMQSLGVPQDGRWNYVMNPFTAGGLADAQNGLTAADGLVRTAWEKAQISRDFGGMMAMTSNALTSYTTGAGADRVGALNADPIVTYVAHKDTMIQTLVIKTVDAVLPVKAGDVVEITGRNRVNLDTGEVVYDETGAAIPWRATVTADAVAVAGIVTVLVAGPAIFEANGQYNTVDSAPL
ncbi:MAG: head protein, partial [Gammaproteobacteria bacterium]|nr:head protein [Gammaproteobacteria bacterium]